MRHTLLIVLAFCLTAHAEELTDITSMYLQNPSFEQDDITKLTKDETRGAYTASSVVGWTLSGSYGVSDIMTVDAKATDNDFGKPGQPSDGKQMYYIRNAWSASTAQLRQTITLPTGNYRLSVDNKCITASSHAAILTAAGEQTSLTFSASMPSTWTTTRVDFQLAKESSVTLGLTVNFGSGSGASVLIDNFRLYQLPDDYSVPEDPKEDEVSSFTEGIITPNFVPEAEMMNDLLVMLARFSLYMKNDFFDCQYPNSKNEPCGYFNGESSGQANEAGVRTNADLSMLCAFLVKYAKPAGIELPKNVTWERIEEMAMKSLVFAYSTHKANKLKVCAGSTQYWGSTSNSDHVWESSLWAMSVAYSAYFQWDKLTTEQKKYVYAMLKAECNYELERSIPTGYNGDTKAEENGWEADVLAVTLGLFPDDVLAPRWFARLREFAINSYSHHSDAQKTEAIDPDYDNTTFASLFHGNNLYSDYSLQNHNLFHTSYQNVVMQELGEAALALQLFQGENQQWKTRALMHNNQPVMDEILNWLALTDGELAMPNGNDWSLFLYDQITSYTTQACFQRDANALMLENLAYKYIKSRQQTTNDGAWLLRPDVQARRMGVEGHRVMMTYLMHLVNSTANLTPTTWEDFRSQHSEARLLPCQNIVRAFTPSRFTCFSWSEGLKSYTGYFASNSADKNKIVVPYRANNTGNLLGWYTVSGKGTNATPVVQGIYQLQGDGYVMNAELNTNDAMLNNRFVIYSTPGNAIIYLDNVSALASGTITGRQGGMLAISTDELTKLARTLYYDKDGAVAHRQLDGTQFTTFNSNWINIDNELGVVGHNNTQMAFGDRSANNSIFTSKLYPMYDNKSLSFAKGNVVDQRNLVYYSLIDAETTAQMNEQLHVMEGLPTGWNGVVASDPDGTRYLLVSNFRSTQSTTVINLAALPEGTPVLTVPTTLTADGTANASVSLEQNHSLACVLNSYVKGIDGVAVQDTEDSFYLTANKAGTAQVNIRGVKANVSMKAGETRLISLSDGSIVSEMTNVPEVQPKNPIKNPNFDEGTTAWTGTPTVNYTTAEKFSCTFNVNQKITGLQPGRYLLSCQGFYRYGAYANAATAHNNDKEKLNAQLYATTSAGTTTQPLQSIFSEAGKLGSVGVKPASCDYIPDNMLEAHLYFIEGLYPNELEVTVPEDGTLTIGVKKTALMDKDWTIFDNFSLTYLGQEDGITSVRRPFVAPGAYTLNGVRVGKNHHGIVISEGKKVIR